MRAWEDFLPDVLPEVLGCAQPVAAHALLRAAQEFFQKTRAWNVWLDPVTTVALVTAYDLELESRSELVRLEAATLNGKTIGLTRVQAVPADWRSNNASLPTCVFTTDSRTVQLVPAKAAGMLLAIQASLKPSNAAAGINDDLFDRYVETIAVGAKARLMAQPRQGYSNPELSGFHRARFDDAITTLKTSLWRGTAATRPRSTAHFF